MNRKYLPQLVVLTSAVVILTLGMGWTSLSFAQITPKNFVCCFDEEKKLCKLVPSEYCINELSGDVRKLESCDPNPCSSPPPSFGTLGGAQNLNGQSGLFRVVVVNATQPDPDDLSSPTNGRLYITGNGSFSGLIGVPLAEKNKGLTSSATVELTEGSYSAGVTLSEGTSLNSVTCNNGSEFPNNVKVNKGETTTCAVFTTFAQRQKPPEPKKGTGAQKGLVFEVTTDKSQYVVGEDISITIEVINTSDIPQTLSFSSSKQADYTIGRKFRWSEDKFFAQFLTSVEVPGNSSYRWNFTHRPADYKLEEGKHTILGEVVEYGSASIQITVKTATSPLTITTIKVPPATVGTPYKATISASGGSESYSWSVDNLPPGLSLVSTVCIVALCQTPVTISGTPTTAGNYTFIIVVSDGTSKASKQFTINVFPVPTPLTITTASLPSATVGTAYSASISAFGGSGSYFWSLASGTLPPGLALFQGVCVAIVEPCQAPAEISGTPTVAGTYKFVITVTDGTQKASRSFTIIVNTQKQNLSFEVFTDKTTYTQNEDIIITVRVKNESSQNTTLNFASSKQADYTIGGKFRWSADKLFTQVLTSVPLGPFGIKEWEFIHTAAQYPLSVGTHIITGEVVGYGSASVQVTVESAPPPPPQPPPGYSESFEKSFGGWTPDHQIDCEPSCTFNWSIERSTLQAHDGVVSLRGYLDGTNDDGTIWVERPFTVTPNSVISFEVNFYLWSENQSEINQWPVVAYIGLNNPERESDFNIIGNTDEVAGWRQYSYTTSLSTASAGVIWIAFGFGATWEIPRTYFLDSVSVQVNTVASASPATSATIQVQVNALNVRQDAALSATKIGLVRQGETLKKLKEENGWVKVELSSGKTGWVFGQYVAPATVPKVIVTARVLNVRSSAGINTEVIATVQRNAVLEKVEKKDGWIKIILPNDQRGWVYEKFVK